MESIVGQTVSHYAFLEKLGSGGMGEIYKARDSRLNRIVAVKVLAPGRTRDPLRRRRFIQEAQAASALNHPNIVTIHDILPEGDTQYMVMEHVSGNTLHQMIAAGRLPVPQVLQLAIQMANALAAAHGAGIIHRDFKPANVMVTGSGLVKILDFGLAKLLDPEARPRSSDGDSEATTDQATLTQAPLTVEGAIMGTVNYMSPEQAEGLKVDARSDIFSFGAVLYEMVTGQRAFDGDSGISTLSAVLRDEVKPIRELAPEVPGELDDLIARCLRKNPGERWQSMSEVAEALVKLKVRLELAPTQAPQPGPAPTAAPVAATPVSGAPVIATGRTRPNRTLLVVGGAAVLAVAIAGAWWQTHRQNAASPPPPAVSTTPTPAAQPAPATAAPTPTAPEPAPQAAPDAKSDAVDQIVAPAPPPPSSPALALGNKPQVVAPPPVVMTKPPANSQATANGAPPVPVLPVPRAPSPVQIVPVTLRDGVPFRIALLEDVPLDADVGQAVHFRVLDGLKEDDVVVIAKGAVVTGAVAELGGKRNFFGERSKVKFRLISAVSVDDAKINVRATPASKSEGVEMRPFVTPNERSRDLKEKSLIAAGGTEYVAYVAGDQTVSVHK
jgi:tRNA A-37 threonylcarbamoyl transferase component Bud32